jgi:RNA polymerase sigma factor (sigma-70 family)
MTSLPEPTETAPAGAVVGDAELLDRVRGGDKQAYGVLWNRHHRAGLSAARAITSAFDAEDLVSEAFVRVLKAIERGNGPTLAFRPYLVTAVRSVAARWGAQPAELTPDELEVVDPASSDEAFAERFDQSLTVRAFNTLPQRWQEVLWYTEAEQLPPREVAALIGIKPNAVSALAKRAREGLRHAWVQAHIESVPADSECRWSIDRLAASTRKSLPAREQDRLDAHLDECDRCPLAAAEMTAASRRLGALILIGFLGAGAATAYAAFLKPAAATAATLGAGALWPPKPTTVRNVGIGAGAAVVAGAIAVGVAFAANGGGAPRSAVTHEALSVTQAAPPVASDPSATDSSPSASPSTSPSSPAGAAPPIPPASAPAPPPAASASDTQYSRPAPSPSPSPIVTSTPAPTPTSTPTPTPTPTPAAFTEAVDTHNGEFYPVVSGTAPSGSTVTISDSNGTSPITVHVLGDGSYTSAQFVWSGTAGTDTLTVTDSKSATTFTETVSLTPPSGTDLLGVLAITGDGTGTIEVDADGSTQLVSPTLAGVYTATAPLGASSVQIRYADSASSPGRFGPWVTVV